MANGSTHGGNSPPPPPPPSPGAPEERPPLGSWTRLYLLCIALALLVMLLLYWFSSHYNVRMPD